MCLGEKPLNPPNKRKINSLNKGKLPEIHDNESLYNLNVNKITLASHLLKDSKTKTQTSFQNISSCYRSIIRRNLRF